MRAMDALHALTPDYDLAADAYRRRVLAVSPAPGLVVCDLEDDFHHFRVTLRHDGDRVTAIAAESIRYPWVTCPDAAANLDALVGLPLSHRFTAAGAHADPRRNCTHQFDAAALAVTHAARGAARRVYDAEVPRRVDWYTHVRLWVDGEARLSWQVDRAGLVDPEPPFDAAPWEGGFMAWADATLDPETAEAAIVLRRAATIGMGRGWPFDDFERASDVHISGSAVCYTMTPGVAEVAWRRQGLIRDFAAHPERMVGG
jgi:hypothetical protein